ncbi:uncharacterized protein LOC135468789 [Liolophura sinensis]|uniref:uncharacterized protein LOC135468789 n=1 Tax=Liolophura sinensis TaxID=3198878 RepID=UPI003159409A
MDTQIEHMYDGFMSCHSITKTDPDVDLEHQMLYIDENYSSCDDHCAHGMYAKDSNVHKQFSPWILSRELKDWHQSDLEAPVNVPVTAVYGGLCTPKSSVCETENVTKLIQDAVWYSPEDGEGSENKAYACDCFDLSSQYEAEGFIDEENLLLGIPTKHVPRPSQFITVETESWDQVVPYISTCPLSDDDLLQVVPLCDGYSDSDGDHPNTVMNSADNYQFITEDASFCCPHSYLISSDEEEFGLVSQSDIPVYSHRIPNSPHSTLTEGSESISSLPSCLFDLDSDILSDGYDEVDRPIDSCSAQDFSVPLWAVEE